MNVAERIRMIQGSAEALAAMSKAAIQLILSEHGVQTYDYESDWGGSVDPVDYCTRQLQMCDETTLASIHDLLLGSDAPATAATESLGGPWTPGLPVKVFLSHLSREKAWVSEVKRALAASGIDGFVAHEDIHPSREWRDVIKLALRSCDAIIVILHDDFHDSEWCDQEVGWALARGVPVVPVNLTTVPARHGFLADIQHILAIGMSPTAVVERIVAALDAEPRLSEKLDEVTLASFIASWSYNQTRTLWPRLSTVRSLSDEQVVRLRAALRTNNELYNATALNRPVSELVEELIVRLRPDLPPHNPYF